MRVHVFQHVAFEGPARIEDWAIKTGHRLTSTRFFAHERPPALDAFDMLVVMGGPMGANDDKKFSWMKGEKAFIAQAIDKGKKVLGVCLGAQLMASALGAKVYPNRHKEIGWYPIELIAAHLRLHPLSVLPQKATVFHWHGDTFDLPEKAVHLARSAACENQAFAVGAKAIGLQFHLEMGMPQIETLLRHASSDLTPGTYVMKADEMLDLSPSHGPPLNAALCRFLDAFSHTS